MGKIKIPDEFLINNPNWLDDVDNWLSLRCKDYVSVKYNSRVKTTELGIPNEFYKKFYDIYIKPFKKLKDFNEKRN